MRLYVSLVSITGERYKKGREERCIVCERYKEMVVEMNCGSFITRRGKQEWHLDYFNDKHL